MSLPKLPIWLTPASGAKFDRARVPHLPSKAPACFRSQGQWNAYKYICDWLGHHRKLARSFDYCRDCTPEHRDAMVTQSRCAHPGTIFSRVHQIIVGRRQSAH